MEQTRKLLTKVASHAAKSERLSGSPCLCYMYNGATVGRDCFATAMSKCYMIVLHRLSGLHSPVIRRLMPGVMWRWSYDESWQTTTNDGKLNADSKGPHDYIGPHKTTRPQDHRIDVYSCFNRVSTCSFLQSNSRQCVKLQLPRKFTARLPVGSPWILSSCCLYQACESQ